VFSGKYCGVFFPVLFVFYLLKHFPENTELLKNTKINSEILLENISGSDTQAILNLNKSE